MVCFWKTGLYVAAYGRVYMRKRVIWPEETRRSKNPNQSDLLFSVCCSQETTFEGKLEEILQPRSGIQKAVHHHSPSLTYTALNYARGSHLISSTGAVQQPTSSSKQSQTPLYLYFRSRNSLVSPFTTTSLQSLLTSEADEQSAVHRLLGSHQIRHSERPCRGVEVVVVCRQVVYVCVDAQSVKEAFGSFSIRAKS